MSWLTLTNLGRMKDAAICRMLSTIFWTCINTISLSVILIIRIADRDLVIPSIIGDGVVWSEIALVQNLTKLTILLGITICLGWGSLVLDVIIASVKFFFKRYGKQKNKINEEDQDEEQERMDGFWNGTLLLEGLSYV